MELVYFGMIIACIGISLYTAIGISLREIKIHTILRQYEKHPHARRWRQRPTIALLLDRGSQMTVKNSAYRKLRIANSRELVSEEYSLRVAPATHIDISSLKQAITYINGSEYSASILLPSLNSPSSHSQLLSHYRIMLDTPLATASAGFGLSTDSPHTTLKVNGSHKFPGLISFALSILNLFIVIYSLHVATALQRPELLLFYLAGLLLWAIWSIGSYPYLSFGKKAYYTVLFPAALPSLLLHIVLTPLKFIAKHTPLHIVRFQK